ncbi:MAG: aminotransferase class V-fold PLP-dependent enzyme [Gammaproteobacteria bacterium]|nr:MAG: aminotransferase class V-fold PLP-dependent enzyme [Gammaproteobacteria bacterium]
MGQKTKDQGLSITTTAISSKALQDEFPVTEHLIYLNHAAVGPWPRRTAVAVERFAEENAQLGATNYTAWLGVECSLKYRLMRLINAESTDSIALLKNTSEALSFVAYGINWPESSNIVIAKGEFPSNRIVWQSLRRLGVSVHEVDLDPDAPERSLIDACDQHTHLMSVSSVSFATGLRLNLEQLGAYCHSKGVLFCIDAIQSLGAIRFDVEACQADFVAADGHKWMLGPEGIALFYCHPRHLETLSVHEFGWHMIEDPLDFEQTKWQTAKTAQRFECGSPNMLGIHALDASLSLLEDVGMTAVERAVIDHASFLSSELANIHGVKIASPRTPDRRSGIVSFTHEKHGAKTIHQVLTEHNIICAVRHGQVRLSPHFYNNNNELETAIKNISDLG